MIEVECSGIDFAGLQCTAAADRDRQTLSVKTRFSQLRTRQIDHRLGQGTPKAMGNLSRVTSVALKLYLLLHWEICGH